jgi:hypothetical protein
MINNCNGNFNMSHYVRKTNNVVHWTNYGRSGVDYIMKQNSGVFIILIPVPKGEHRFNIRSVRWINFMTVVNNQVISTSVFESNHDGDYITRWNGTDATLVQTNNGSTTTKFKTSDFAWTVSASTSDGPNWNYYHVPGGSTVSGNVNQVDITINVIQPGVLCFYSFGAWVPVINKNQIDQVADYTYDAKILVQTLVLDLSDGIEDDDLYPSDGMRNPALLEKYYAFKKENSELIDKCYTELGEREGTVTRVQYIDGITY